MNPYMVVCTFRDGTNMQDVLAVVAEEQARVEELTREGRVGGIHLALARGTVFIETSAESAEAAADTVRSLPMAQWWDLDVFPLGAPVIPEVAA